MSHSSPSPVSMQRRIVVVVLVAVSFVCVAAAFLMFDVTTNSNTTTTIQDREVQSIEQHHQFSKCDRSRQHDASFSSAAEASHKCYLTFAPIPFGYNNRRICYESAILMSLISQRTLVLPPRPQFVGSPQRKTKSDAASSAFVAFEDVYDVDALRRQVGLDIITHEEFLRSEAFSTAAEPTTNPVRPAGVDVCGDPHNWRKNAPGVFRLYKAWCDAQRAIINRAAIAKIEAGQYYSVQFDAPDIDDGGVVGVWGDLRAGPEFGGRAGRKKMTVESPNHTARILHIPHGFSQFSFMFYIHDKVYRRKLYRKMRDASFSFRQPLLDCADAIVRSLHINVNNDQQEEHHRPPPRYHAIHLRLTDLAALHPTGGINRTWELLRHPEVATASTTTTGSGEQRTGVQQPERTKILIGTDDVIRAKHQLKHASTLLVNRSDVDFIFISDFFNCNTNRHGTSTTTSVPPSCAETCGRLAPRLEPMITQILLANSHVCLVEPFSTLSMLVIRLRFYRGIPGNRTLHWNDKREWFLQDIPSVWRDL